MSADECEQILEDVTSEEDLVKKGVKLNRASECYKKLDDLERYKSLKLEAIKAFECIAKKEKNNREKCLYYAYEGLCWICLGELEKANKLADKALQLLESEPRFKNAPIVNFIKFLANNEIEKAQNLWREIYMYYSQGIVDLLENAFTSVNPSSEPPIQESSIAFSKRWNTLLAGKDQDPEKDWTLVFYDMEEIFEDQLVLKKQFVEDLLNKVKEQEHYHFLRNIRSVTSSTGENLSNKALFIMLATSKEKKLKFGLLFGTLKDGGVHVIALWPEVFAQAVLSDKNIIGAFITRSIKEPEWFGDLNVLTFISSEGVIEGELLDEKGTLPEYFT